VVGLPQFELGLLALVPLLDGPQVAHDARVDLVAALQSGQASISPRM